MKKILVFALLSPFATPAALFAKDYSAFCKKFIADCQRGAKRFAPQEIQWEQGSNSCKCWAWAQSNSPRQAMDKEVCEANGLKHNEMRSSTAIQAKLQGMKTSECYVK